MLASKIKESVINYFKVWWIPISLYFIPFGIFLVGSIIKSDFVIDLSLAVFLVNVLGNLISSIVQIIIKKWVYLILQLGVSALLFFLVSFLFAYSPPDYYGANKDIPNDIEIFQPIVTEPSREELDKYDLILASLNQPGIYNYYTDHKPIESGHFYIKAFEVTSNDRLSEKRVKSSSAVKVIDFEPRLYSGEFTIYEGSWGDKYGARIELWFEPSNGKEDYKITERNYVVEGWMR